MFILFLLTLNTLVHLLRMTKRTMTLNLTATEMKALEDLCRLKDLSKTAVIRQALRLYQMVDRRERDGQKLYFEDEDKRKRKRSLCFYSDGLFANLSQTASGWRTY